MGKRWKDVGYLLIDCLYRVGMREISYERGGWD